MKGVSNGNGCKIKEKWGSKRMRKGQPIVCHDGFF